MFSKSIPRFVHRSIRILDLCWYSPVYISPYGFSETHLSIFIRRSELTFFERFTLRKILIVSISNMCVCVCVCVCDDQIEMFDEKL